ncbi:MAG: hypothetical protein JJT81_20490 [Rubellimicrobium sp.]|nr:hypothetical protein [Rubellimicrobium sp.]
MLVLKHNLGPVLFQGILETGRILEEKMAEEMNNLLVQRMRQVWDDAKRTRTTKGFVKIDGDFKDGALGAGVWGMIPNELKDIMRDQFNGEPGIMVREDMLNNVLGYRMPSVGDMWSGESDLPGPVRDVAREVATLVLGNKAKPMLVTVEKLLQNAVGIAKTTIVVRSVIVPYANALSNVVQLMGYGVPLRNIVNGSRDTFLEITKYLENRDRIVEIEALLGRYRQSNDRARILKLEAELQTLENFNRRMKIWPLVEAGEFTTIAEGMTEVDASIRNGNRNARGNGNRIGRRNRSRIGSTN